MPGFFKERLALRDKKLKEVEQEKRNLRCIKVDAIVRRALADNSEYSNNSFAEKAKFANLHPASKVFDAILQGRGGTSVGNLTFKNCKRVS